LSIHASAIPDMLVGDAGAGTTLITPTRDDERE
jgi:hypothetical protein